MLLRHITKSYSSCFRLFRVSEKTLSVRLPFSCRHLSESARIKTSEPAELNFQAHPIYYYHFNTFLTENEFHRHIPGEVLYQYKQTLEEFIEVHEIVEKSATPDSKIKDDFVEMAKAESEDLIQTLTTLQDTMLRQCVVDDRDVNECSFEVRAGVGGKEACFFAEELFQMYNRFVAFNNWEIRVGREQFELVKIDENTSLWTSTMEVIGQECYRLLRHEAGIHRVQRVPVTERHGRMHTSTVSVSVLPVRQNLVNVKDSDLRFEVKNSSGAGGQNVNRNLTCVRCIHVPTGLAVEAQETRYQHLNKSMAIRKIKALLNQLEYDRLEKKAREQKRVQIGIAARSDKIRTYNFQQNRITDHRIQGDAGTIHNIAAYMAGQECDKIRAFSERLEDVRQEELARQLRTAFEQSFIKTHKGTK